MNCSVEVDADGHHSILCPTITVTYRMPSLLVVYIIIMIIFGFITLFDQLIPAVRNYIDYGNLRVPRFARERVGNRDYMEL